jgi:hypothetical protein
MRAFERQPGETEKAFEAYSIFRNLGPGRTLRGTAAIFYDAEEYRAGTKRVPGHLKEWSAKNDWVERVRAYDDWLEMIRREAVVEQERKQASEFAEKQTKLRELLLDNALKAAEQERAILEWPLEDSRWTKGTAKQLHDIAVQTLGSLEGTSPCTYDLSNATEDQLERIVAGEDPARVLQEND